jgi:FkbM family methyltransferase
VVDLPWGLPFEVSPAETIGRGIWRLGVHELAVSEVLWRLVEPGEVVVDAGANTGYFSALMGWRVGRDGLVKAFEPHPAMRERLEGNIARWKQGVMVGRIEVYPVALSDAHDYAKLCMPDQFDENTGTAYLGGAGAAGIEVETRRLEEYFPQGARPPSVVKVDVEGHEAGVLSGAGALLAAAGVRDVVFEEHRAYPAESARLLESRGYEVFRIDRGLWGPRLSDPRMTDTAAGWEAPNFLATLDPVRARGRLGKRGWACLRAAPVR